MATRRVVFIVSRERQDLYEALRKALVNEQDTEVILDRRASPARRPGTPGAPSRRARTERRRHAIDREVARFGWAVLRLPLWPRVSTSRL